MSPRRGARSSSGVLSRRTLVWVAVLVIVLVVVDVLLVALALSRTAPVENRKAGPVPTFTSTPMPSASGSPTPSASATSAAAGQAADGGRLLSAVSASEAWRASSGNCGGSDPSLEHTTDGGKTWSPITLGNDIGTVLALRARSDNLAILVGVGADCDPTVRTSADDGVTWKAGAPGDAGAGIVGTNLVLSTGTIPSPCADPIQAFQGQYTTAVVCDGQVTWRSGTRAWVTVPLSGVRSLVDSGDKYTIARVHASGCGGIEIASLPAVGVTTATVSTSLGCDPNISTDGRAVLANAGSHLWLWSGEAVHRSDDGGGTWSQ